MAEERPGLSKPCDYGVDILTVASSVWGMKLSLAKRIKELEQKNSRLKRAMARLIPDKLILKEAQVMFEIWR